MKAAEFPEARDGREGGLDIARASLGMACAVRSSPHYEMGSGLV